MKNKEFFEWIIKHLQKAQLQKSATKRKGKRWAQTNSKRQLTEKEAKRKKENNVIFIYLVIDWNQIRANVYIKIMALPTNTQLKKGLNFCCQVMMVLGLWERKPSEDKNKKKDTKQYSQNLR